MIQALACYESRGELQPFEYDPGPLGEHEVEIDVRYCGICHSDLSMIDNEWGISQYPLVPGHEVVGHVAAVGERVQGFAVGDSVGLGWYSRSCGGCRDCMSGDQNLCTTAEATIVGRHGGFATRVRAHSEWVIRLPEGLDPTKAGPLFCGGATVFNPFVQNHVRPTDRVGVVGIGGLGHMALQFARAWGCEVTAFSGSADKESEARALGAHCFVVAREPEAITPLAGTFDMILVTVGAAMPWDAYVAALRPRGKLHLVGAAPAVTAAVFPMIIGQKAIGGSPLASPETTRAMVDFAVRHDVAPMTEHFPMSQANEAMDRLRNGSPRYRIVLENDLG
ncbi:MAG: NADPH-dependent aldehyde reductase Ahr [Lacipirellulaceae bacterium]